MSNIAQKTHLKFFKKQKTMFLRHILTKNYNGTYWPLNNLKQELSNSLILGMSHAKFENFTNQRALETWARKEREKRLDILPAIHDLDDNLLKRPNI